MRFFIPVAILSFVVTLISCKKEVSYELGQKSKGALQDSTGNCLPKTVNGTYSANKALTDSNSIDVTVTVAQTGTYAITTDTINGYYFKVSGKFTSTGPAIVRLKGYGKPLSEGLNNFTVQYDSSSCIVPVTVLAGGGSSGGTAVYALQDSSGNCMNDTVSGTYIQGIALTTAEKVVIQVNVTTVGTWSISTAAVDGFLFSGSGTFTTTGVQTITLAGSGTPAASGAQIFSLNTGTSVCSFVITVAAGASTSSNDYFPLTQNSYWTYDLGTAGSDTSKRTVSGTSVKNSNTYQQFITTFQSGPPNDTSYYRKDNATGFYYNYVDTSAFSGSGASFSQPGLDILFLKNNLTTGAIWNSDFNATASGVPITVRFNFTCTNASATLSVNGNTFTNVYQITLQAQIGTGGVFSNTGNPSDFYYAKGVGLIKIPDPLNGNKVIRYWQVF